MDLQHTTTNNGPEIRIGLSTREAATLFGHSPDVVEGIKPIRNTDTSEQQITAAIGNLANHGQTAQTYLSTGSALPDLLTARVYGPEAATWLTEYVAGQAEVTVTDLTRHSSRHGYMPPPEADLTQYRDLSEVIRDAEAQSPQVSGLFVAIGEPTSEQYRQLFPPSADSQVPNS
jgi:hypothetical protein